MKTLIDIPDKIIKIFKDNPNAGRRKLISLGVPYNKARMMSYLMKNGNIVNETLSVPNPESGSIKTAIFGDTHFPHHNEKNVEIAINYALKVGVKELIIGGDGVDMNGISYWFNKELKDVPFEDELEAAKEELTKLSSAFGDIKKIYIRGNHESRLLNYVCQNARKIKNIKIGGKALTSVKDLLDLDRIGFDYVDNLELIKAGLKAFHIGKLFVLHGDEPGKIGYNVINPAKLYFERLYASAVIFHLHRTSEWVVNMPLDNTQNGCWTGGCLCDLTPNYAVVNRWHAGFVIVERDSEGYFDVQNKRIVDGRVV